MATDEWSHTSGNCRRPPSRRELLCRAGGGFGGIALAQLLGQSGLLAGDAPPDAFGKGVVYANGGLHHPAKAKRVIQLFMNGGASQIDTFDYKPRADQAPRPEVRSRHRTSKRPPARPATVMKSPFEFKQHGQMRAVGQQRLSAHRRLRR